MKRVVLGLVFVLLGSPAYAQFGSILHKAEEAKKAKDTLDALNITEKEEYPARRAGQRQDPRSGSASCRTRPSRST